MLQQVLDVTGMRCGGCERLIGEELGEVAGVLSAHADANLGTVRVELDEHQVQLPQVVDLIRELGFAVSMMDH